VDPLDDALERFRGTAPEFGHGLSNHGPMAAEALVKLDRPDEVAAFADRYLRVLEPAGSPGKPLVGDEWQDALGRLDRWPDWVATFLAELSDHPVKDVVATWVPRLAPGTMAGATHGLIRVAHGLRALSAEDNPGRRRELAEGLGYWAARYQELPGPPVLIGTGGIPETLAGLPVLPEEAPEEYLIFDQVRHVEMIVTPFAQGVAALAPPPALVPALDAVAGGGAAAYLANAGRGHEIALVHAVTSPLALELVLPSLRPGDRPTVFAYAWQAVAALHVAYAVERVPPRPVPPGSGGPGADVAEATEATDAEPVPEWDALVDRAVAAGDEHAIKLTEAAGRAHARTGDPALLRAAADCATRFA
jgi:hypothetical protein